LPLRIEKELYLRKNYGVAVLLASVRVAMLERIWRVAATVWPGQEYDMNALAMPHVGTVIERSIDTITGSDDRLL